MCEEVGKVRQVPRGIVESCSATTDPTEGQSKCLEMIGVLCWSSLLSDFLPVPEVVSFLGAQSTWLSWVSAIRVPMTGALL